MFFNLVGSVVFSLRSPGDLPATCPGSCVSLLGRAPRAPSPHLAVAPPPRRPGGAYHDWPGYCKATTERQDSGARPDDQVTCGSVFFGGGLHLATPPAGSTATRAVKHAVPGSAAPTPRLVLTDCPPRHSGDRGRSGPLQLPGGVFSLSALVIIATCRTTTATLLSRSRSSRSLQGPPKMKTPQRRSQ